MTPFFQRLAALVEQRGLTNTKVSRYLDDTEWDNGRKWHVATMGPVPTRDEIDAITVREAQAVQQQAQMRVLWSREMEAVVAALHDRIKADGVSLDDFKRAIETQYDNPVAVAPAVAPRGIFARAMSFIGFGSDNA